MKILLTTHGVEESKMTKNYFKQTQKYF